MHTLTTQDTMQVGAAGAEYSRVETLGMSALSAAATTFGLTAYNAGLTAAFTTTVAISGAATAAVVAIPATIGIMVVKQLISNYYAPSDSLTPEVAA